MASVESKFSGANDKNSVPPRHAFHLRRAPSSPITESEVLIESEFLELNDQLQYSKTVHILLTDEFVFVKEMRDRRESEAHVLQYESAKMVSKYRRSDVNIELYNNCPFTFKAKWSKDATNWKTYELCGKEEVWPKWLRSFSVEETQGGQILPSSAICEMGADTDSDDSSEDEDGEEIQLPKCTLSLSVDQTISMWSMSMLNPNTVRRLRHNRPSLGTITSDSNLNEVNDPFDSLETGSLYRSNSHPRIALAIPFRCPSLPNVGELDNLRVDSDLRNRNRSCSTRGETSADDTSQRMDSSESAINGSSHKSVALSTWQERVENLRAHPSNLNFVRKGRGADLCWCKYTRKLSLALAMGNEANRIPIPSNSSPDLAKRGPPKKRSVDDNRTDAACVTPKSDYSPSPRTTDLAYGNKNCYKRADSLPCPKRSDLSHVAPSVPGAEGKGGVAKRLDFKDDMAVDLNNTVQKPRKIRRFLTILYKKRPKLRTSSVDLDEPVKESENTGHVAESEDCDTTRANNVVGLTRRGGFSGDFSALKDKVPPVGSPTKEEPGPLVSPVRNRQDPFNEVTPGRSSLSSSGSMKKKTLVKKILSPIFKSSSVEEEMSNQAVSPTGEVPMSPDWIESHLPDLSQRLVDIDATLFAREITLIDKELFIRIPWPELSNCGWMTKDKYLSSPNVMAMVEFFNRVALLAASEILSEDTPTGRARVISKVIQIADKCHILGNFNSLKALLAGLQSTPIYRLKETWKEVSSKRKKKFRDLSILMGESDNFMLYRSELSSSLESGPCLPFLGNFLTEIAQTHTYLACKRKNVSKTGKQSSSTRRNDKHDRTDGGMVNGLNPNLNGITVRSVQVEPSESGETSPRDREHVTLEKVTLEPNEAGQTSPRDRDNVTLELSESGQTSPRDRDNVTLETSDKRNAKVKRSSSRSKLRRFYNRSSISDSGVMLNRSRNSSAEVLNAPENELQRSFVTSSSDSVITSTGSLNESPRNPTSNSRTPSRPPLLRRLSETSSSSHNRSSMTVKPKRRLSESKGSETRRSLKALIRRTPSSHSVKEGRVSRGTSSEKLTVSLSTLSVTESSNALESFVEKLAKSQSSPSVKEGSRVSPEFPPGDLGSSPEVEAKRSSDRSSLAEDSPMDSNQDLQSGTERQLWSYQIASIQYDFVSRPFVRHFLLSASFNSEEENYRLSLKRETPSKKASS